MQRPFIYRTVPELKFRFTNKNPLLSVRKYHQRHSQKCISTQPNQKVVFKTMNNILLKDYDNVKRKDINHHSILQSKKSYQKNKLQPKRVNTEMTDMKFYQIDASTNNLNWQKWKRPFSIVNQNKKNISNRDSLCKNYYQSNKGMFSEKNIQEIILIKKTEKELNELKRFKASVQNKKEILNLMQKIEFAQNQSIEKAIDNYKVMAVDLCEFYKNNKFDYFPIKAKVKKTKIEN